MSPTSKTYLRLATLCTPLDYPYCIGTFRIIYNDTKPNNLERRLTNHGENIEIFLPLFQWRPSVPFFCINGKYKACSVAWAAELSGIFIVKLKQCCPFSPFWRLLRYFCALFTYSHHTNCGQVFGGSYHEIYPFPIPYTQEYNSSIIQTTK